MPECWTYFGDSTEMIEGQINDLIGRGGIVQSIAIGYGPTPAKAAGKPWGDNAWHAMLIVDPSQISDREEATDV